MPLKPVPQIKKMYLYSIDMTKINFIIDYNYYTKENVFEYLSIYRHF